MRLGNGKIWLFVDDRAADATRVDVFSNFDADEEPNGYAVTYNVDGERITEVCSDVDFDIFCVKITVSRGLIVILDDTWRS